MAESELEVKHHLENGGNEEKLEEVEEEDEETEEDEEEGEDEREKIGVKKRRCQRRKKAKQICFDYEGDEDEEEEAEDEEEADEGEEEEEEDDEGEEEKLSDISSYDPSVLSAISFIWANEVYEFEELCDPRMILAVDQKPSGKRVPTKEVLDQSGRYRYLKICKALNVPPMTRIIRLLDTDEMDLSFCNVNSKNIRALCAALEVNTTVEKLIMKYNKLVFEDCYFIGFTLEGNETIYHLDFAGCRVGPEGLEKLIVHLPHNQYVTELNLSKCQIGDEGMKYLAYVLTKNNSIQKLDISYNNLGEESGELFAVVFKLNSSVTDLNLRYNNLFYPSSMKNFFRALTFNTSLTRLDLSWNGMSGVTMGSYVGSFLKSNESIRYLDLSDNRFEGLAAMEIKKGLSKSRSLEEFKIGKNPMSCEDLEAILTGAKTSMLKRLDLEDLWVKKSFIKALTKIQQERNLEVNYAGVLGDYEVKGPDYPKLILQRAQFEAMKPKIAKKKRDFGHLMWTLGDEPMTKEEFMIRVNKFKAKINKELYPELLKQFTIPKAQLIDVVAMRQKYLSIFPDSTPPPPSKVKGKKGKEVEEEAPIEGEVKEEKAERLPDQVQTGEELEHFTELEDEEESELMFDMVEELTEDAEEFEEEEEEIVEEEEEEEIHK